MKTGTTDVGIGTRVRITMSSDPDLIGLTGTITHPFESLVQIGSKYIVGIRLDKKGVFADDIANLLKGDKFKIIDTGSDNEEDIPRKWEYIADQLDRLKAPAKVVNAAIEIDNAMVKLGLGYHTDDWVKRYPVLLKYPPTITELHSLVSSHRSCTACLDCLSICTNCKLGTERQCTPRSKHADRYYGIVKRWIINKIWN